MNVFCLFLFFCFSTCACVRYAACISTVVCDVPEKAKLLLDCVSGQQHSVKTLILIENFDADLVSRAQQCGIDIISLRDAEVNKLQIVCSNLCITPVNVIDACVCVWWGLFVLLWPGSRSAVVTGWPALLNACPQSSQTLQLLFIERPSSLTNFFFFFLLPCYRYCFSKFFFLYFTNLKNILAYSCFFEKCYWSHDMQINK